jgi:GDP-4-dehydro-6-deoxy-D-mannose reductase
VRDVCTAYAACVVRCRSLKSGMILNIGSGEPRRIRDILMDLLWLAGITAEIRVDQSVVRADDLPVTVVDASRARELLRWEPDISWEQTLQDVLNDWRTRIYLE